MPFSAPSTGGDASQLTHCDCKCKTNYVWVVAPDPLAEVRLVHYSSMGTENVFEALVNNFDFKI
jgi:hypothetical protein